MTFVLSIFCSFIYNPFPGIPSYIPGMAFFRLCGIFLGCFAGALSAITIHNTSSPGYLTGNSVYTGVASIAGTLIAGGGFNCTGALIAPEVVITAGHCTATANQWNVTFETASGIATIGVTNAAMHPLYANRTSNPKIQQFDVALLRLAIPAPLDAAIYTLADGTLPLTFGYTTGTVVDQVGYGYGGNPSGALTNGVRRRAGNQLFTILGGEADQPLVTAHDFSSPLEPPSFGIIAAGDSGGPMFLNNQIIGIASASSVPAIDSGTYPSQVYYGLHTNVYEPLTYQWLTSAMITTPEPGSYLLLGSGLTVLALIRRRA